MDASPLQIVAGLVIVSGFAAGALPSMVRLLGDTIATPALPNFEFVINLTFEGDV